MQQFQSGDKINHRYRVLRKLGAGAMGSVYLCEDLAEKRIKVAMKVLVSAHLDDQDIWAKGEYEALTRLRHPNLAKVHNFGRMEGTKDYFIVSEFIKGVDLFSGTEYLKYDEITDIIVQICRALEYIHSQGYVHFDVKPDNVLVSRHRTVGLLEGSKVQYESVDFNTSRVETYDKPVVKLIDFGLAERISGSFSFAIKGTLNYLAPEILNGSTPDKRADLYSLGVTIYQILNRDLPFCPDVRPFDEPRNCDRTELFEANMKKHPDYIRQLTMRLLEEDPDDRFQSAKEVIQFLNKNSEFDFEVETAETRESYFHSPRLVGRKKEVNLLKQHYESIFGIEAAVPEALETRIASGDDDEDEPLIAADETHLILVSGPMGSGKSRLLEEFQHFLKLNDTNVFRGNCYEGKQTAYQPFVEMLRELVCCIGPESDLVRRYEDVILRVLPELSRDPGQQRAPGERPEKEKPLFIERLSHFLVEASETAPYVVVFNNLHWVDDASVDLLESLFDRIGDTRRDGKSVRILVLASQRAEEQRDERTRSFLDRLKTEGLCVDLPIRPLRRSQISELLQCILRLSDIPGDFAVQLEEQTGGNPLFLIETLKALEDEGVLKSTGDGWTIKTGRYSRVEIPSRMEDLLLKRFERLDERERRIVAAIAVLDKPVSAKFLQTFKCFRDEPMLVDLRNLESSGILHSLWEGGKLNFQIGQPKLREIVYTHIDEDERRRLHGEVGAAYEEEYRHREDLILEELAYHYQRSDRAERAVRFALLAGDRLKGIFANERAHEYYQFVLDAVADRPEFVNTYFEVREKLGDLCMAMGRYAESVEHYGALLIPDVRDMLELPSVTKLYLRMGRVNEILGDYDQALHFYKEARNYLSSSGRDPRRIDRARVFNSIGWVYVCMGKYEKAMTISLEALRVLHGEPERLEHAMIYGTIGTANYYKGNLDEAVKYHRKSLRIKENLESLSDTISSLNSLGAAYLAGADYGDAAELFKRAHETSEEIGDPYGKASSLHNLAELNFALGRLDDADRFLSEAIELSKNYNMRYLSLQNYAVRGLILVERKEYTKAEGNLIRVLTSYAKQGNRTGLCTILIRMTAIHRLRGNAREARSSLEEAKQLADDLGIQHLRVRCCLEEARLVRLAVAPDYAAAVQVLNEGLRIAAKVRHPELIGELNFELAEVLVCVREVATATEHYKVAEERFREVAESLPPEFRADYERRQKVRFPNWSSDQTLPIPAGPPTTGARLVLPPDEALRRVAELMQSLVTTPDLKNYLQMVLDGVLAATGGDVAYVLSLSGRNVSVAASASLLSADQRVAAAQVLCLSLIDRALKDEQPVLVSEIWSEPEIAARFDDCPFECRSVAVLPYLDPEGKKGALYLLNSELSGRQSSLLRIQPFLNLIPVAYLHFRPSVSVH